MEEQDKSRRSKGGRPGKEVKREALLGVKCTKTERFVIKAKAEKAQLTVSEYLRQMGINGKIDMLKRALPPEVLRLTGTLNHMAANLNQIAKKRNSFEELNAIERAELQYLSGQVKQLAIDIKNYLQ
ncbi:mobilization protein [Segetibacter sp. 3557_3]|uniref:plasmid mobilization protein n=1 Tax=Segetibacter sp. 3557_3 TaxID=2547429 RepID=UPI0010591BBA|nr:mobilization protein [Segetibacter sp. 3557_3]TDH23980.1 mobilization protein [Segetibacter sp. 3557_3]